MSGIDSVSSSLIRADYLARLSVDERETLAEVSAQADTVTISDEARAVQETMAESIDDMSDFERATALEATNAGDVMTAVLGSASLFDGVASDDAADDLAALIAML